MAGFTLDAGVNLLEFNEQHVHVVADFVGQALKFALVILGDGEGRDDAAIAEARVGAEFLRFGGHETEA